MTYDPSNISILSIYSNIFVMSFDVPNQGDIHSGHQQKPHTADILPAVHPPSGAAVCQTCAAVLSVAPTPHPCQPVCGASPGGKTITLVQVALTHCTSVCPHKTQITLSAPPT